MTTRRGKSGLPRRSPLAVVYLTVFIDLLGFGIILPALPFYAERLGATGLGVGAILTAYSAAQFVGAPLLGRISDRVGRRRVILVSLLGAALSLTATGLANTLLLLVLARALAGLFGGSIATAQAYVADVTSPEDRTRYMGLLGAAIGLGFIFGPAIGAGLSPFGFSTAAFVAAGLAAANLAFGFFTLREPESSTGGAGPRARLSPGYLARAVRHPSLGRLLLSMFLAMFAFVGMEATFALLGERQFGLNTASLGLVFAFVGLIIAGVQGGLVGPLSRRFGERALAVSGAVLLGLALLLLPLVSNLALAVVVMGVLAMGQGLLVPSVTSLVSQEADPQERGGTLGLGQALSAGARATGPLTAGWLFDVRIAAPYLLGAMLALLAAWLLAGTRAPRPQEAALLEVEGAG